MRDNMKCMFSESGLTELVRSPIAFIISTNYILLSLLMVE